MGILLKAFEEIFDLLVNEHIIGNFLLKYCQLLLCWQISIQQEEHCFHIRAIGSKLVNGIPSVQKLSFFSVDECDLRDAACGRCESRIVCVKISLLEKISATHTFVPQNWFV